MRRVQAQFTDKQFAELERRAEAGDQTVPAVLRQLVDEATQAAEQRVLWERTLASVGGFQSGLTDISENHDAYLGEDRW